jgi:exoenzyme U
MTAALVAAGITADEFTRIGNADETTGRITEGSGGSKLGLLAAAMKNKVKSGAGNPLTGQGLEDIVKDVLDDTMRTRIEEYMKDARKKGGAPDQTVVDAAKRMGEKKTGPTFMDLRIVSKVIPAVKEVVITGTYTTEFEEDDKGRKKKLKEGNDQGQLYVFDADSEPDLPVSVAVHASASFPIAFKPVDIKLSSGLTVRFIDGGVMNNTPTTSSIGNERNLDPMPEGRGMTFVFDDKEGTAGQLTKGMVQPGQGFGAKVADWITGSNHSAGEYAKNRDMTDRPEEIVVVPLQVTLPLKKPGGKGKKIDMRDGTLNFGLSLEGKLQLQSATKEATNKQIEREKAPKTREFASDAQMFVSIPMEDLKALVQSGYEGAADALTFRERAQEMIGKLHEVANTEVPQMSGHRAVANREKTMTMVLDELEKLSAGNVDFQGYVGRELNKGGLDLLLEEIRKGGGKSDVLEATFMVSDALKVRTWSDNVLKQLVYPKMKTEPKGGSGIETLMIVEGLLRAAKTAEDYNDALKIATDHFKNKSDRKIPKRGHNKFAAELQRRVMPTA